jgi:purine-nucleoside phosphorylase
MAPDGAQLTVQSTGMGGPSAAIVIWELAALGARWLLRVGTCGGLERTLALGELVIASEALACDGASRALGAGGRVGAGPGLLSALTRAAPGIQTGVVASTDLFYGAPAARQQWVQAGAVAVDMETATLFTLAPALEVESGSLLVVSDLLEPQRTRIASDALSAAEIRMGEVALRALERES